MQDRHDRGGKATRQDPGQKNARTGAIEVDTYLDLKEQN